MIKMRRLIIVLLLFGCAAGNAQTLMNVDSLLQQLKTSKDDTNKVLLLINIGQQYEDRQPAASTTYYNMAGDLSRKLNYKLGIIKFIANYTYVLNNQGLIDSGLILNLESLRLAKEINDSSYIAKTSFNVGSSYRENGDYENAVKYYTEGREIFLKSGNEMFDCRASDILQALYLDMHQNKKGIEFGEHAVALSRKQNDSLLLTNALTNLGLNYSALKFDDKALKYYKEALVIGERIKNLRVVLANNLNIGDYYLQTFQYNKTKFYFTNALTLARQMESYNDMMIAFKGLSLYALSQKDYMQSKLYADSSLTLAVKYGYRHQQSALFTIFSNISFALQDMQKGEEYARKSRLIDDSLLNESIGKSAQVLETKFETKQKLLRIQTLETQQEIQQLTIQRKNLLNIILITAIALFVLIALLLYRNYKNRQKLQQQRITELETEKQLAATEAVLKGEEQERTRMAKDLHDGLGGMLSGIKYSLNNMKGNMILTAENAQAFERSIDMLDSSIQEMRRVAHNMMPEALVKFGLDTALKDFCTDINQSGALKVTYQSIGLSDALIEQTTAITIYRIVQELINNSIKHAKAKQAIVQLTKTDGQLSLTVEDDGKGFDTTILKGTKGIGWSNIQNRVEFLKGKLDVSSEPDKGTSVLIEMNA